MPKSPLDMLNMFGKAAHMKAQKPIKNSSMNMDDEMPQSKKVAAMKEQEKAKGKMPPKKA